MQVPGKHTRGQKTISALATGATFFAAGIWERMLGLGQDKMLNDLHVAVCMGFEA